MFYNNSLPTALTTIGVVRLRYHIPTLNEKFAVTMEIVSAKENNRKNLRIQ